MLSGSTGNASMIVSSPRRTVSARSVVVLEGGDTSIISGSSPKASDGASTDTLTAGSF
jgi:hypothetical protein